MKTLTGGAATAAGTPLGIEPIIVIAIHWRTSGVRWYGDRVTPVANDARILRVGSLVTQKKQTSTGTVGSLSILLDDQDDAIKALVDSNVPEGTKVQVYQSWDTAPNSADLTLLLSGVLVDPEWSEGERTFSFEVESRIDDKEVGFAIEREEFDDNIVSIPLLDPECIDRPWPLVFGSAVHVPALRVMTPPTTTLSTPYKKGTHVYFDVEDATYFPDGVMEVEIDGMIFYGSMDRDNNRFTVGDPNVPKYQNIPFADRDADDEDYLNPYVAWISQDVTIVNHFVLYNNEHDATCYHRIIRQEGRKIWFDPRAMSDKGGPPRSGVPFGVIGSTIAPPAVIKEVAKLGRDGWAIEMTYSGGVTTANGQISTPSFTDTIQVMADVKWDFKPGEEVRLWSYPPGTSARYQKYIANAIASNSVRAVYAWRRHPKTGVRRFRPLPNSYYSVQLSGTFLGRTCTIITLHTALEDYASQGWEDGIYVSLKSSVGPNAANVIKWLIDNYSNLTADAASFTAVATKVTNYPVGFARFDREDALALAEQIAWQSRCALIIQGDTLKIKYISEEPASDYTVSAAKTEFRTTLMTYSNTEDVVTQFRGVWLRDYSDRPKEFKTHTIRENIDAFGLKKESFDFFIYNVDSLAEKSIRFWAHRYANSWRFAKLNVLDRTALALEVFDCVTTTLAEYGGTFKSIVEAHSYEISDDDGDTEFSLSLWLPSKAGTITVDPNAWMSDAGDTLPDDPVDAVPTNADDEQWGDDLSAFYGQAGPQSRPAKIVSQNPDTLAPGSFLVNCYDNGFEDAAGVPLPPTNVDSNGDVKPIVAWPTDIALALDKTVPTLGVLDVTLPDSYSLGLPAGTKIAIFNATGGRWLFNAPADSNTAAAVATNATDGLGRQLYDIHGNGFDNPPTKTNVPGYQASGAAVKLDTGERVIVHNKGGQITVAPVGITMFTARVSSFVGGGVYGFEETEFTTGAVKSGGRTGNAREMSGSTVIDFNDPIVVLEKGGTYIFWYPLRSC